MIDHIRIRYEWLQDKNNTVYRFIFAGSDLREKNPEPDSDPTLEKKPGPGADTKRTPYLTLF